jgi:hypothetical protein
MEVVQKEYIQEFELIYSRMYKSKKELIGKLNNNQPLSENGENEKDLNKWIKNLKYHSLMIYKFFDM